MAAETGAAKVISREYDLTTVVAGTSALYVGILVEGPRGSINYPKLITSDTKYLQTFAANSRIEVGADLANFNALQYLTKGSRLQALRVVGEGALYAGALTGTTVTLTGNMGDPASAQTASQKTHASLSVGIPDPDMYQFDVSDTSEMLLYAKDIEVFGNRLSYAIANHKNDAKLKYLFVYLDGVLAEGPIAFGRKDGYKDGMGQNTYCENVINNQSAYMGCVDNPAVDENVLPSNTTNPVPLGGGTKGASVTNGDRILALKKFYNKAGVNLTMFMDGGIANLDYQQAIVAMAESRQDCVGILSVPYDVGSSKTNYLEDAIAYRNSIKIDSTWAALYFPHVKIYDKWNDRDLWVSPVGHVAAQFAQAADKYEYWYPVGGKKRGVLTGVKDVQVHLEETEMDELVDNQINPIRYTLTEIMIWGQETLQVSKTHLSDLHVRMALIGMRPPIAEALSDFNFDFNDVDTRSLVSTMVSNKMDNLVSRNAFADYMVKCDEDNNSADDIDNNRMNLWVFVKPKGYNKFIRFDTILTPNSMSFTDAVEIISGGA